MATADRGTAIRAWSAGALLLVAAVSLTLATARSARAARPGDLPDGVIAEVRFQGNKTITPEQMRGKIKSRAGRPLDRATIEDDMKALLGTKWFSDVRPTYEPAADGKGFNLTFQVAEMPVLGDVQFIGRDKVKLKDIEETTGLKKGSRADWMAARQAVQKIQTLYEEKGYEKAEIRLIEGGNPGDSRVVIEIFEGPKFKVGSIDFVGNTFVEDGVLATKIESRRGLFGLLGAKRYKDGLENDRRALMKYYQDHGFFGVAITATTKPGASLGDEQITFTISEGPRYKVGAILFEGNKTIPEAKLRQGLLLKVGEPYNEAQREIDLKAIYAEYWKIGCIKTRIEKDQPVTETPGVVNVVYKIDEGDPFILGRIIIKGNGRTREKVVRAEALMAGLLPGEVLDLNRIDIFKRRLAGTGYFQSNPQMGKPIEVQVVNERPGDKPFGDDVFADPAGVIPARMQSPDRSPPRPEDLPPLPPMDLSRAPARRRPSTVVAANLDPTDGERARLQSPAEPDLQLPGDSPALPPPGGAAAPAPPGSPAADGAGAGLMPFGGLFSPPANTVPSIPVAPPPTDDTPPPIPPPRRPANPNDVGDTIPGRLPSLPNTNMTDVGPDLSEPFKNRSYADIVTQVDEAPTGRFMIGVGATSFGGLSGNVIFHESNFDLFAWPRSFSDLTSRRAFRGGGQELRIELSPGTLINRYVVSYRNPYLFELPIGFGLSGYQTSRSYLDFSERRSGGRVSLGYQFSPQAYADVAARIEDVYIHGYKYPAPADLLAVQGHTTLFTLRPSLRFDNRNNPTAPSKGSYLEAAFEQGLGTFTFPKFTLEGRQHFTTGSRPDNSGKRTLTFRGVFGVTGRDTPIYERFFAGDFRSMRGFQYRGVGPHVLGVNTGGIMESVGSIEYQFPWNASDTLQQVIFADFGTVEADYKFTTFRASVGTGLRVVIPQITGQLPLSFDLAFPVSRADGDKVKYFSFFIGAFW